MLTLQRYLARQIFVATGFVLVALLAIFVFFDVLAQLDDLGRARYTLRAALAFVALSQPARVYELMPIAALIGTIFVLARLAASSEFTIIRGAGLSSQRLARWLVGLSLVFVALTYLLGEVLAPPAERLGQKLRLQAMDDSVAREFRSGSWVREAVRDEAGQVVLLRFINVREVLPDASLRDLRVFEFDAQYRLRSIRSADGGRFDDGGAAEGRWRLDNVTETRFPELPAAAMGTTTARTQVLRTPQVEWRSELTPDIFGVSLVKPERMDILSLALYVRHLQANQQRTERYEIALWTKVVYPWVVLVMMMLALPFAYLHVRAGGVSLKIFGGVMIGVLFYMLNKLSSHVGLLNTWPPVAAAILPSLLALAVALAALYWIERR